MSYQSAVKRLRSELGELLEARENVQDLADYRVYDGRPLDFFRDVLSWTPWSKKIEATQAIDEHPMSVLVGAQGVGKDALLSAFSLYWTYAKGGLVLLTAPTQRQIRSVLFGEIARLWHGTDLPGELFTSSLTLGAESDAGIIGFTSTSVSALTGFHASRCLGVLSESQGLSGDAWEGLLACCVGADDRIVCSGNPLYPSGRFHQAAGSDNWGTVTIPVEQNPNIIEGRTVIPGGPSVARIERMKCEYGAGSNTYRSRVLSEFPDQGEESLFSRSWLDAAAVRWSDETPDAGGRTGPPLIAVDVARYDPDSSIAGLRRGLRLECLHEWRGSSTTETVSKVKEIGHEAEHGPRTENDCDRGERRRSLPAAYETRPPLC